MFGLSDTPKTPFLKHQKNTSPLIQQHQMAIKHRQGFLMPLVDATEADQRAVITARLCTVKASELLWPDTILDQEKMDAIQSLEDNNKILLR